MPQPHSSNRYRGGQSPPRPPARPRPGAGGPPPPRHTQDSGHYGLIDPNGSGPRRSGLPFWAKIAAAVLIIGVAYIALKVMASGNDDPAPVKQAPAQTQRDDSPGPPSSWEQRFDATLRYGGHIVVLQRLRVDQLTRKSPQVRLSMAVTPRAGLPDSWIKDKRRYSLAVPNHYVNASRISMARHGNRRDVKVDFRWPKAYMTRGSRMMLQLPSRGGAPEVINVAVELPESGQGVEERTGAGRL